jgi:enoyl-CoA hydratase
LEDAVPIHTSIHDHIGEIVLDQPPVNALDSAGWNELARVITGVGCDPEVRVVLIRAIGRGFCAGVDIKEMQQHPERIVELNRGNLLTFKAVRACEVPVITAVHGFVVGGGIGICGASDVIFAAGDAFFSLPVRTFAAVIASKSRTALRLAKEALNGIEPVDVDRLYRFEQGFTLEMYLHQDSQRARDAFVENKGAADFR